MPTLPYRMKAWGRGHASPSPKAKALGKQRFVPLLFPVILLFPAILLCSRPAVAELLYIFQPLEVRPRILQKSLTRPGNDIDVTVFGRYRDFRSKTLSDAPDAILTKPVVIRRFGEYRVTLLGTRDKKSHEQYVFLSIGPPFHGQKTAVGMFDLLGRKGMVKFLGERFTPPIRLKRVTKLEDLMTLLTLDMAGAILVPDHHVPYFRRRSRADITVTPALNVKTGIIALALKGNGNNGAGGAADLVRGLAPEILALLGIDGWEEQ